MIKTDNVWDIIAVDISGRHPINDIYYMVCAAVAVTLSSDNIEKIKQIKIKPFKCVSAPTVTDIVRIIEDTVKEIEFEGTIITEQGDLFNKPERIAASMFSRDFKYQESLGERRAIELAHHVSLSSRNVLIKKDGIS
jgi:hypothetical protein